MRRLSLIIAPALYLWLALAQAAPSGELALPPAQREWLAQHRVWRIGVVLQAPYAQFDRRAQQLSGLNVDVGNALGRVLGVELQWKQFPDQAALDSALRHDQLDLATGLMQTPAGLRLWSYSDPYLRVAQRVVGERNGNGSVDLEALYEHERIAARGPGPLVDYLRTTYPNLEVLTTPQERRALEAVVAQQARFAVVDEAQLSRLSREPEFAGLAVVADVGLPQLLRVGSRADQPQMAEVIEAGLHAIPAREIEQWRERWLQPAYPALAASPGFWQNICLLLLVLGLALAAIVAWQRRQQQHLEQRLEQAREAMAQTQAREAALRLTQFSIDQSTVGILWVNWDSHIRYANRAAESMLEHLPGALVERPLADLEPGLNMDRWLGLWRRARAGEDSPVFEIQCRTASGGTLPVDVALSFLRFEEGEYLVVFLTDVSERRRTQEQLRELTAHLETVREEEKARIAREVHDELGQVLTVLKLEVTMCELGFSGQDPHLQARMDSMKRLIAQLFQQVRDVATALRPPILDAGLGSAIEWQATRFEGRTQIPCLVQLPEPLPAMSDAMATGLFRILQEALTNIMRHAQAHSVEVSLVVAGDELELLISDDGRGFDVDQPRPASFGLVGMRERVMLLGGRLAMHSEAGEGTTLRVRVPLQKRSTG
ncbi:histidine kinase [Pseudomonas sp. NPDC007930]|uniref:sensor histidine kinase n=1 Tax=Pseudomonas sp. NPDC007930 TaxID=3364417 RepID=UPI0036E9CC9E